MPSSLALVDGRTGGGPQTASGTASQVGSAVGFGVYVHWPFCLSKCPYCDFNSHVRAGGVDEARFLAAYRAEIAHMAALSGPSTVDSVFFGGGTPSLMRPATVGAILDVIAKHWSVASDVEVTLEANPSSVEAAKFAGYRAAGVNRVSLGVQALDDRHLRALGRLHSAADALKAVAVAQTCFERVSCDLIYARPGQGLAEWEAELSRALALGVAHLSLYQLTIEEGTAFAALHRAGKLVLPDEDAAREFYDRTQACTQAAGYNAYEISNHAQAGAECRHNLIYWRSGAWAGVGPGAHARLLICGRRHAAATLRAPEAWLAQVERTGHGIETLLALSDREAAEEYLLMGLRLAEGIECDRYAALSGRPLDAERIADLEREGLIMTDGKRLAATTLGRPVLNSLIAALAA